MKGSNLSEVLAIRERKDLFVVIIKTKLLFIFFIIIPSFFSYPTHYKQQFVKHLALVYNFFVVDLDIKIFATTNNNFFSDNIKPTTKKLRSRSK